MAVTVNNRLAAAISNNTERFGGFASLAMHNATVAAAELTRSVKELGLLGELSECRNDLFLRPNKRCTIKWLSTIWVGWPWAQIPHLPRRALIHSHKPVGLVTPLYYDQPEYDIFWQTLSDLDVPLYLHPRTDVAPILTFQYSHSPFLIGPAQQYTATLSGHILGYASMSLSTFTF